MGVVDFMDVSRGPYIFELAGAAMDAMMDRDNPLDVLPPPCSRIHHMQPSPTTRTRPVNLRCCGEAHSYDTAEYFGYFNIR